jgi:hypothetical protein
MRVVFRPNGRPDVPAPRGVTVVDSGLVGGSYREAPAPPEMTIVRRWFSPVAVLLSSFCVVWAWFLWSIAITGGPAGTFLLSVGVPMGLGLTYWALCGLLNRTTVVLCGDTLVVWHGPILWAGKVTIPVSVVERFVCEERLSSSENPALVDTLSVVRRDGRKIPLLSHVAEPAHATFVKRCLDRCLVEKS